MVKQIIAIAVIFLCITFAWLALASFMEIRTTRQDNMLKGEVGQLWGTRQSQEAPKVYYITDNREKRYIPLDSSRIDVKLKIDYRQKGLLWYSTYIVDFAGKYRILNSADKPSELFFEFNIPIKGTIYKDFKLFANGKELKDVSFASGIINRPVKLSPGQMEDIGISYSSQGIDEWNYVFGDNANQIKDFSLKMVTDFKDIDFPQNSISPSQKNPTANGWELGWNYSSLLSDIKIGMVMPHKLNPGPWAAKITFFAPLSLFFFLFVLFVLTNLKGVKIHPANYLFTCAAYFSFHLLLAYLVDHISIHLAFFICSFVSIFLVVSYMRIVVGKRFAFVEIGVSQFVFLVVFSYTFFFEGYTGLAIVILCILTLFIIMQMTAKIDWSELMLKSKSQKIQS